MKGNELRWLSMSKLTAAPLVFLWHPFPFRWQFELPRGICSRVRSPPFRLTCYDFPNGLLQTPFSLDLKICYGCSRHKSYSTQICPRDGTSSLIDVCLRPFPRHRPPCQESTWQVLPCFWISQSPWIRATSCKHLSSQNVRKSNLGLPFEIRDRETCLR
jgi:hypothetical protein